MRWRLTVMSAAVMLAAACFGAPPGILEGHLSIVSLKEVELAEGKSIAPILYDEYPLLILSQLGKKEITRVTAGANGNYRVSLPPGDYILDIQNRVRKHVRARPKEFRVESNQTVRVNMEMDTGVR